MNSSVCCCNRSAHDVRYFEVSTGPRRKRLFALLSILAVLLNAGGGVSAQQPKVPQQSFVGANNLKITVKEVAPGNQDCSLQIVCYLKHKPAGDVVIEAMVTLDQEMGGVIHSLRDRGEFTGESLETLYLVPHAGSIKAKGLLLAGLGSEETLSLDTMKGIGTVALREAMTLKATRVSFAPTLRDQKVSKLDVGDVAAAVMEGVILAYDTDIRLQKQGLLHQQKIQEWIYNAGPAYFARTVEGVQQAVAKANSEVGSRSDAAYGSEPSQGQGGP